MVECFLCSVGRVLLSFAISTPSRTVYDNSKCNALSFKPSLCSYGLDFPRAPKQKPIMIALAGSNSDLYFCAMCQPQTEDHNEGIYGVRDEFFFHNVDLDDSNGGQL